MGLKPKTELLTQRINEVIVDVHVIGKYPWGECILFVLKINNIPKFSIVVDSCESDIDILKNKFISEYGIKSIDVLCWTHPHEDHSIGMKAILEEYCNKDTIVIEPQGIEISKDELDSESKEVYKYLNKLNRRNTRKNGRIVFATEGKNIKNMQYIYSESNKLNLSIETYSPIDIKINNLKNNKNKNLNDYSILMCVTINKWKFLFSGDIEDSSINHIKERYEKFYNVIFLKIPHHGSKSSGKFIDLVEDENNNIICASTVYNRNDIILPNAEVLNKYTKIPNSQVYCTSLKTLEKDNENEENYGIISTRYELYNNTGKYAWDCKTEGEAFCYNEYLEKNKNLPEFKII